MKSNAYFIVHRASLLKFMFMVVTQKLLNSTKLFCNFLCQGYFYSLIVINDYFSAESFFLEIKAIHRMFSDTNKKLYKAACN